MELVPISASNHLTHVQMPPAVQNPEADGDGMENPMQTDSQQVHPDTVVAGYPAIPYSVLPILDSDEHPTEVTPAESGPDVGEADPIQEPPYAHLLMILNVNTYANVIFECSIRANEDHIGVYESILTIMKQIWTQMTIYFL